MVGPVDETASYQEGIGRKRERSPNLNRPLLGISMEAILQSEKELHPFPKVPVTRYFPLNKLASPVAHVISENQGIVFSESHYHPCLTSDRPIALGTMSEIFSAVNFYTGRKLAVKRADDRQGIGPYFEREIEVHEFLKGNLETFPRGLAPLLDYFNDKKTKTLCLVYPLYEKTIEEKVFEEGLSFLKWKKLAKSLLEVQKTLASLGVIHRDISPSNVMESRGEYFLIDLGVSSLVPQGEKSTVFDLPSHDLTSPEQLKKEPYDSKSDLWSIGMLLYFAATQGCFLESRTKSKRLEELEGLSSEIIQSRLERALPEEFSKKSKLLLQGLLVQDPLLRLSADEALQAFEEV
jgi:calcium/calmodulin-dependent protein kinase I